MMGKDDVVPYVKVSTSGKDAAGFSEVAEPEATDVGAGASAALGTEVRKTGGLRENSISTSFRIFPSKTVPVHDLIIGHRERSICSSIQGWLIGCSTDNTGATAGNSGGKVTTMTTTWLNRLKHKDT